MIFPLIVFGFLTLPSVYTTDPCPSVCFCKWKSGKQTVECTGRGLITIPEGIAPEYQVLDISGNNLQILPKGMFARVGLLNLQKIYMRECKIGQIDLGAFRGLSNLVELDLSNNLLTSVPSNLFIDVPSLRDLSLANNPIQKIESFAFRTVHGLVKLDLSHCELKVISPKAFDGVELLESLKLNGNKLTQLQPKTVETLSKLHGVELHGNPWYCDCNLRAAKLWLMDNNIPYPVAPVCRGGPERVLDKSFAELQVDDFACKPIIKLDSRHVEATSGGNATIVCRVESTPAAHISWFWNGRLLQNNSAFSSFQRVNIFESGVFEKKSSLVITNAQEADTGDFFCVAENRAGNAEGNYSLHVSARVAGISTLGSNEIVMFSALFIVLIIVFLMCIVIFVKMKRVPFNETKTPASIEVVANGNVISQQIKTAASSPVAVETSSFIERKAVPNNDLNLNPIQKPPRAIEPDSNPDLINDTKRPDGENEGLGDTMYSTHHWDQESNRPNSTNGSCYDTNDKTPIIEEEYCRTIENGYPPDYGLPIVPATSPSGCITPPTHPSAKTLRVWQRGVPVLPPVTALKRVLGKYSPDEGYQTGGCGTDV